MKAQSGCMNASRGRHGAPTDAQAAELVRPGEDRSTTQRSLPRPEPCSAGSGAHSAASPQSRVTCRSRRGRSRHAGESGLARRAGHVLDGCLASARLSVEVHEVALLCGHSDPHGSQTLELRGRQRVVVRPRAACEQMRDVARTRIVHVLLQQARGERFDLAKRLPADVRRSSVWSSWSPGIAATSTSEAAGYRPSCGSTGPSAECLSRTISSARAMSVPPLIA
jgi:hypothetical protein